MHSTIFIHGTLPPKALFTIPAVYRFFYCPPGLVPFGDLSLELHHRKLIELLIKRDPKRFSPDNFFVYGWSGKLSRKDRRCEAEKLYSLLLELPKPIRIISYSHGGNIVLLLAEIASEKGIEDFLIDELILIACPVQRETKMLAKSPIFRTIYSLHSHLDVIQVADPQGLYELAEIYKRAGLQKVFMYLQKMETPFSERHFPPSNNIFQINTIVEGRNLWHIEFMLPKFFKVVPEILDRIEQEEYIQKDNEIVMKIS